ncbi:endonuclease VII [Gordonia phage Syleon]|uniref:Endonuclease VII n=1 Tax=Gordonia phage Syleon TaxID=2653718 RepID=A0A5Q2WH27_9CAUD|nr:endonuclease VII [Gordonia phage Syleon]QGH75827.1 endonuclease VII [Gordonia phage Syleon]
MGTRNYHPDRPPGRPAKPAPEGERWCTACQACHPVSAFSGVQRRCREAKARDHRRRTYGLTDEQYEALKTPDGKCPICKLRPGRYIDHNHETGQVRGILCQPCNTALGAFAEDPEIFARALEYLGAT